MDKILEELKTTLKNKAVLVACSSGVDSTVLLDLVLKSGCCKKIVIGHVNHKKRTQSDIEEAYLVDFAKSKGIGIYVKHLDNHPSENFQAWARSERYKFFKEVMEKEKLDYCLTAHHANDQAETVLMRLLKQSSMRGYAGLRKWAKYDTLTLYRPLLEVSKAEIAAYAITDNLKYFDDYTNFEDDYLRNRIRSHVVPFFLEENPSFLKAVNSYAKDMHEMCDLLDETVASFIKQEVVVNNKDITLEIESFQSLKPLLQIEVLFTLLKPYQLSRYQIEEIIRQIFSLKQPIIYPIGDGLYMVKEYGTVIFTSDFSAEPFYLEIKEPGVYQLPRNEVILIEKNISNYKARYQSLWYNIKELPVVIRTRQDGDRIKIKQGTKTVSDLLTDKKVSHLKRNRLLLLCDKDNSVMAILGLDKKIRKKEIVEFKKGGNNGTNE